MTLTFLKNVSVESFIIKPILHETRVHNMVFKKPVLSHSLLKMNASHEIENKMDSVKQEIV